MNDTTLEERVTHLEQQMARLLNDAEHETPKKDWRGTVGMFTDDPVMKRVQEEGQEFVRRTGSKQSMILHEWIMCLANGKNEASELNAGEPQPNANHENTKARNHETKGLRPLRFR